MNEIVWIQAFWSACVLAAFAAAVLAAGTGGRVNSVGSRSE